MADNQLALNAGWDEELLSLELADLQGLDFDLDLVGFDDTTLTELLPDPATPHGPEAAAAIPDDRYMEQYGLIIRCADAQEQEVLFNQLKQQGLNCRVVVT